jgi:hypothetical protein
MPIDHYEPQGLPPGQLSFGGSWYGRWTGTDNILG